MINQITKNKNFGFTLLYASMVAGLLLAIGAAILDVTLKEITLSSAGSQSQFAFYNADTGTECARYLDRVSRTQDCPSGLFQGPFDTGNTNSLSSCNPTKEEDITKFTCLGVAPEINLPNQVPYPTTITDGSGNATTTWEFYIDTSSSDNPATDNVCFDIVINKTGNSSSNAENTQIISRGYNTCTVSSVNRFERAIEVDYGS